MLKSEGAVRFAVKFCKGRADGRETRITNWEVDEAEISDRSQRRSRRGESGWSVGERHSRGIGNRGSGGWCAWGFAAAQGPRRAGKESRLRHRRIGIPGDLSNPAGFRQVREVSRRRVGERAPG